MKKRKWTSQEKFRVVLEGLSGQIEIKKLCAKYQIAQNQYYKWRDQFLKFGYQAFETKIMSKKEQRLREENKKLKQLVGDLTVELKKNEYDF
jgi:transposase-like protein